MIEIPLEGDRILVLDNSTNVKVNGMLRRAFRLHDKLVLTGKPFIFTIARYTLS